MVMSVVMSKCNESKANLGKLSWPRRKVGDRAMDFLYFAFQLPACPQRRVPTVARSRVEVRERVGDNGNTSGQKQHVMETVIMRGR